MRTTSWPEMVLTSAAPGACPATPHCVAPTDRATPDTAARTDGIACIAAVLPAEPARSDVW